MKYQIMIREFYDALKDGAQSIGIYGIGMETLIFMHMLGKDAQYIKALYDDDTNKIGLEIGGLTVKKLPEDYGKITKEVDHLFVAIFKNRRALNRKMEDIRSCSVSLSFFRTKLFVINSMPKSGSVFMLKTLMGYLDSQFLRATGGRFPDDSIVQIFAMQPAMFFPSEKSSYCMQEHFAPTKYNLDVIFNSADNMILHIRDPRQAILSLYHHFNLYSAAYKYDKTYLPENYSKWDMEKQLDWVIDDSAPKYKYWLENWVNIYKSGEYNILLTTHNQLKNCPDQLFEKIHQFYGFDKEISYTRKQTDMKNMHFRKGEEDEWKSVMTKSQQARLNSFFDENLIEYCYTPVNK